MFRSFAMAALLMLGIFPARAGSDYPALYRQMNLPEYPGATVTALGRDNDSLADGMRLAVRTGAGSGELRAFYEPALAGLGWTLQETPAVARLRAAGQLDRIPFAGLFCRDDGAAFQVMTMDLGAEREVRITVNQGDNGCGR